MPIVAGLEEAIFSDPWPAAAFTKDLENPALAYRRVARFAGAIVGYLVAWRADVELHLLNLAVVEAARRQGVARALIADLEAEADRMGAEVITLEVRVSNAAAIQLYERHGFRIIGRRKNYYEVGPEDALVMLRELDRAGGGTP